MSACREMNQALAEWQAANGNAMPSDVESVMQLLADRGYNSDNWKTLTSGYEVYWYKEANRMVLYSTKENVIVYPEEFTVKSQGTNIFTDIRDSKGNVIRHFQIYNNNYKKALTADFSLGSVSSDFNQQTVSSYISSSSSLSSSEKASLTSAITDGNKETNAIRDALNLNDNAQVYVNSATEFRYSQNTGSYSSMQVMHVSNTEQYTLQDAGNLKPNLFYINTTIADSADSYEVKLAQKEASELVYDLFVQINNEKVDNNVAIVLAPGTILDASEHEWVAVKYFKGYFGTPDGEPVVIDGFKLTTATGYAETISFDGSEGKYFVTGFFGSICGETTIENVTFRNLTMEKPGSNFDNWASTASNISHSRNTVGIIGAVTQDPDGKEASNVILRNITVENSVTIHSSSCAGGLVGYVGGNADKIGLFNGVLTIDNCKVHANVVCDKEIGESTAHYGAGGGIVGFFCRCVEGNTNIDNDSYSKEYYKVVVKDSTFDGTITSHAYAGAFTSDMQSVYVEFVGDNHFENATLNGSKNYAISSRCVSGASVKYIDTPHVAEGSNTIGNETTFTDILPTYIDASTRATNNGKFED